MGATPVGVEIDGVLPPLVADRADVVWLAHDVLAVGVATFSSSKVKTTLSCTSAVGEPGRATASAITGVRSVPRKVQRARSGT